jgi:hypothetical protein
LYNALFQDKNVSRLIWNTKKKFNPVTFDNDFVILKLEDPLHFGIDVQPAHLPNSEQVNEERCFVSGWGSLEPGTYLRALHLHMIF